MSTPGLCQLFESYGIHPRGVIHAGASTAQELNEYLRCGVPKVVWIEGDPDVFQILQDRLAPYPHHVGINALISDRTGQSYDFHVASNHGESSSLFAPDMKAMANDGIAFAKTKVLLSQTMELALSMNGIEHGVYDYLALDLQGAELMAIRGMGGYLPGVKWVLCEVHLSRLYWGCPLADEVTSFMRELGFEVIHFWPSADSWGDILFARAGVVRPNRSDP